MVFKPKHDQTMVVRTHEYIFNIQIQIYFCCIYFGFHMESYVNVVAGSSRSEVVRMRFRYIIHAYTSVLWLVRIA